MPTNANFIFEVSIAIPEAFTLDSVVRSPRTFKPKDLRAACDNNQLVVKEGSPPLEVQALATYMMTDFFAMAHSTGLYNRQRRMWEALSQVNSVSVQQLKRGVFRKTALPVYDFSFFDYKGKPLLYVLLVHRLPEKTTALKLLKQFIGRARGKSTLTGALAFFPAPMPQDVLKYVDSQTWTSDPIARYESVFAPLAVPFDILETAAALPETGDGDAKSERRPFTYTLRHPDLRKTTGSLAPIKAMRVVMPSAKREAEQASEASS